MINADRIRELRDEVGPDDLDEVVDLFCEEMEEVLETLDQSTAPEFPDKLHFLKGSAMNLGFDRLSDLCQKEEHRLKSDPDTRPDIHAIRTTYAKSRQLLMSL